MNRILFHYIFLLLLITPFRTSGQKDSTLIEFSRDEDRIFKLINDANTLYGENPKDALDSIQAALELSYKYAHKEGQAYCFQTLSAIQHRIGSTGQALIYSEKAMRLFIELGLEKPYLISLRDAAQYAEVENDRNKAIQYYTEWLEKAVTSDRIKIRESLGRVYFNNDNPQKAIEQFKVLEATYRKSNNTLSLANTLEHLGKSYAKLQDTSTAIRYFKESDKLRATTSSSYDSARYYENLSYTYNSSSNPKKGAEYEKKALKVNSKGYDKSRMVRNNLNIANSYLLSKEPAKAIPFIVESINLADDLGELESSGEAYKALTEAYQGSGQYAKAQESFERYRSIQESILQKKETKVSDLIEENLELFERDKRIALLVQEKELDADKILFLEQQQADQKKILQRQKLINVFLVIVAFLMILGIFLLVRGNRQRHIANKLLAIRSLRSQMNPHFIFNSLNSVNSFISQSDERAANKYLTEFSRLMRMVLQNSRHDFVPLESELEILERYLKLEHLRFGDHFNYHFEIDPYIDIEHLVVPPMLFQPFIENAIWHGLRYLDREGTLNIRFSGGDHEIIVTIEDNGIGRTRSAALKTSNQLKKKSQGIQNTNDRVRLLNEVHKAGIEVVISDLDESNEYPGTKVIIHIPVRTLETHFLEA